MSRCVCNQTGYANNINPGKWIHNQNKQARSFANKIINDIYNKSNTVNQANQANEANQANQANKEL